MVVVVLGAQVEEQRRLAVNPQGAGREHRALDAVRAPLPDDFAHREQGLAADFEIRWHCRQKGLDLLRGRKPAQHRKLCAGQAQDLHGWQNALSRTHSMYRGASPAGHCNVREAVLSRSTTQALRSRTGAGNRTKVREPQIPGRC